LLDPFPFDEPFERASSAFFTATAAAPVAAAAAAALTAVPSALPPLSDVVSVFSCSSSGM
jgi:hypothetical protein